MLRVLLLFALGLLIGRAGAATVYKCTDGKDHVAYQATPCAAHLTTRVMPVRAASVPLPSAAAGNSAAKPQAAARTKPTMTPRVSKNRLPRRSAGPGAMSARSRARASEASSWQCRIGNGEVYYQHSPCPAAAIASVELRDSLTRGRSRGAAQAVPVSAMPLPRTEACRRIHAASASGRAGHERDEDVSSYERSLGRDPCR